MTESRLLSNMKMNELVYDKLYLKKVQFNFDDGSQTSSFKGSFVIERDSQIIVSILAPFGIELVKVRLSPKDVVIIDKLNKEVTLTNYDYFYRKFGLHLDYNAFQSILSNGLFLYPIEEDSYDGLKRYKNYIEKDYYAFKAYKDAQFERYVERGKENVIQHELYVYPDVFRIFKIVIKDFMHNQAIKINYSDFRHTGSSEFPENIKISAQQGIKNFELELKINNIEINDGGSLHFKIPTAYKTKVL